MGSVTFRRYKDILCHDQYINMLSVHDNWPPRQLIAKNAKLINKNFRHVEPQQILISP